MHQSVKVLKNIVKPKRKRVVGTIIGTRRNVNKDFVNNHAHNEASIYHALVVIFLEFFAWGLLTNPIINVLDTTFPNHTLLMNGLIQGVKGFLSFLSAPLVGALSDGWGRKPFLIITVTFTCAPIPLMTFSPWWYFTIFSISGAFAVTFSIVFAFVADITEVEDRSAAYGLVSATFAASLVTSPAIGAYLGRLYSDDLVVVLATSIAVLDILFILVFVPESLPEKLRKPNRDSTFSWDKADPFGALRKLGSDHLIMMLCITTFLSYLPEAGEYSSFFVYLRLVMGFTEEGVASFIAVIGILSVFAQTVMLALLMKYVGAKATIFLGLIFELVQLALFGFGSQESVMWLGGIVASLGSITFPAISAYASAHFDSDQQGVAQGVLTGMRGLCNGLGPSLFGIVFYVFHVNLNGSLNSDHSNLHINQPINQSTHPKTAMLYHIHQTIMPGPPFAFGSILVILAILVAIFIPNDKVKTQSKRLSPSVPEKFSKEPGKRLVYEQEPLMTNMQEDI